MANNSTRGQNRPPEDPIEGELLEFLFERLIKNKPIIVSELIVPSACLSGDPCRGAGVLHRPGPAHPPPLVAGAEGQMWVRGWGIWTSERPA